LDDVFLFNIVRVREIIQHALITTQLYYLVSPVQSKGVGVPMDDSFSFLFFLYNDLLNNNYNKSLCGGKQYVNQFKIKSRHADINHYNILYKSDVLVAYYIRVQEK